MKGQEGSGIRSPVTDPDPVLSDLLERGSLRESCSQEACADELLADPFIPEGRNLSIGENDAENNEQIKHDFVMKYATDVNRTPEASGQKQGNKIGLHPLQSYHNNERLDEHKIDFLGTEVADNSKKSLRGNRRQHDPKVSMSSSEKVLKSFNTSASYPIYEDSSKGIQKRVVIHLQCEHASTKQRKYGKLIILPDSIEELKMIAGML